MASDYERHMAAVVAKGMAVMCFRNTPIEDIHDRTAPVSHTGDFSEVVVIDANGRRIRWREVSHISQDEMRDLMHKVVILSEGDSGAVSPAEAVERLLDARIGLRNSRRLQAAMRSSRLPAVKTLDQFAFAFQSASSASRSTACTSSASSNDART